MIEFKQLTVPTEGERIGFVNGQLVVPNTPIIPVIEGDGIGRDIMKVTRRVVDAAVQTASNGENQIVWFDIYAGENAMAKYNEWLPQDTFDAIEYFRVALKGPLTTPVGGGFRSLNVTLRQVLELYACVRPVRYFQGVPPLSHTPKRWMSLSSVKTPRMSTLASNGSKAHQSEKGYRMAPHRNGSRHPRGFRYRCETD